VLFSKIGGQFEWSGVSRLSAEMLGGSGRDQSGGLANLAVDAAGQAYVTGQTASPDFPVAGRPLQAHSGGGVDAFVAKIGTDTLPPAITITATPDTLWPPNGKLVPVTIAGTITDTGSGVDLDTPTYMVIDEYGQVQPKGSVTLKPDGRYAFTIQLQASRNGNDRDGRQYTIVVSAQDEAGNMGSATTHVIVPHDQRG
jgi:hypothetical protein